MSRKLVLVNEVSEKNQRAIEELLEDWTILSYKQHPLDTLLDAEIILGWNKELVEAILDQPSNQLKWIQSWSAGVNHFPLQKFQEKDIVLTNSSGVHAYPISETVFGFLLAFTRQMHQYIRRQEKNEWKEENVHSEIHGKTIGIIGVGAIGKEVAHIARAFQMKVLGLRHSKKEDALFDKMYTTDELHTLLPKCDYVVITLPSTPETYHLFNKEAFQQMKNSAFLVNIGRGDIVDESALIEACQNGNILGAGLDVFEKEPLSQDSPLWKLDNVMITPHASGYTDQYENRLISSIFLKNLKEYVEKQQPTVNIVNLTKGY